MTALMFGHVVITIVIISEMTHDGPFSYWLTRELSVYTGNKP